MKEFRTAAKSTFDATDVIKFKLGADEIISYRPTEAQLVMLMAAEASEVRTSASRTAAFIDVSLSIFDEESRRTLSRRLLDPQDGFNFEGVDTEDEDGNVYHADGFVDIIMELIVEWSQRPTKPLSDSTSSSVSGGTNSQETAPVAELTSSLPLPQQLVT